MAADSTKERILDISLQLFSQYGFSAVSIRDICGQVHIKESSVYYHLRISGLFWRSWEIGLK